MFAPNSNPSALPLSNPNPAFAALDAAVKRPAGGAVAVGQPSAVPALPPGLPALLTRLDQWRMYLGIIRGARIGPPPVPPLTSALSWVVHPHPTVAAAALLSDTNEKDGKEHTRRLAAGAAAGAGPSAGAVALPGTATGGIAALASVGPASSDWSVAITDFELSLEHVKELVEALHHSSAQGLALRNCRLNFLSLQLLTERLKPPSGAASASPAKPIKSSDLLADSKSDSKSEPAGTTAASPSPAASGGTGGAGAVAAAATGGVNGYRLCRLSIEENDRWFGNIGAKLTADVVRANPHSLHTLALWKNAIGVQGGKLIAHMLKSNSSVTVLDLSNNSIGVDGCKALADALCINRSVTSLNVASNGIGDVGALALAKVLATTACVPVATAPPPIADALVGTGAIATPAVPSPAALAPSAGAATGGSAPIRSLNLQWNGLGDDAASAIAESLSFNGTLTHLDLRWNSLGEDGCDCILQAVGRNHTIRSCLLVGFATFQLSNVQGALDLFCYRNREQQKRLALQPIPTSKPPPIPTAGTSSAAASSSAMANSKLPTLSEGKSEGLAGSGGAPGAALTIDIVTANGSSSAAAAGGGDASSSTGLLGVPTTPVAGRRSQVVVVEEMEDIGGRSRGRAMVKLGGSSSAAADGEIISSMGGGRSSIASLRSTRGSILVLGQEQREQAIKGEQAAEKESAEIEKQLHTQLQNVIAEETRADSTTATAGTAAASSAPTASATTASAGLSAPTASSPATAPSAATSASPEAVPSASSASSAASSSTSSSPSKEPPSSSAPAVTASAASSSSSASSSTAAAASSSSSAAIAASAAAFSVAVASSSSSASVSAASKKRGSMKAHNRLKAPSKLTHVAGRQTRAATLATYPSAYPSGYGAAPGVLNINDSEDDTDTDTASDSEHRNAKGNAKTAEDDDEPQSASHLAGALKKRTPKPKRLPAITAPKDERSGDGGHQSDEDADRVRRKSAANVRPSEVPHPAGSAEAAAAAAKLAAATRLSQKRRSVKPHRSVGDWAELLGNTKKGSKEQIAALTAFAEAVKEEHEQDANTKPTANTDAKAKASTAQTASGSKPESSPSSSAAAAASPSTPATTPAASTRSPGPLVRSQTHKIMPGTSADDSSTSATVRARKASEQERRVRLMNAAEEERKRVTFDASKRRAAAALVGAGLEPSAATRAAASAAAAMGSVPNAATLLATVLEQEAEIRRQHIQIRKLKKQANGTGMLGSSAAVGSGGSIDSAPLTAAFTQTIVEQKRTISELRAALDHSQRTLQSARDHTATQQHALIEMQAVAAGLRATIEQKQSQLALCADTIHHLTWAAGHAACHDKRVADMQSQITRLKSQLSNYRLIDEQQQKAAAEKLLQNKTTKNRKLLNQQGNKIVTKNFDSLKLAAGAGPLRRNNSAATPAPTPGRPAAQSSGGDGVTSIPRAANATKHRRTGSNSITAAFEAAEKDKKVVTTTAVEDGTLSMDDIDAVLTVRLRTRTESLFGDKPNPNAQQDDDDDDNDDADGSTDDPATAAAEDSKEASPAPAATATSPTAAAASAATPAASAAKGRTAAGGAAPAGAGSGSGALELELQAMPDMRHLPQFKTVPAAAAGANGTASAAPTTAPPTTVTTPAATGATTPATADVTIVPRHFGV